MMWRLRPTHTGVDAFKQPVQTGVQETQIFGGVFAPKAQRETREVGREAFIEQPAVYFRNSFPDIRSTDQIKVDATVYDVDGKPETWTRADGIGPQGLVVYLRASAG